ncbi:MAG: tyrosine-type recombinase/integrase, partial [Dehalococcoidia bacterium]
MARGDQGRRPHENGPRLFRRGRWYGADLRPFGGARWTLRDPDANGWPDRGERTEDPEVARRWSWAYVDHCRDGARSRHLKLRARAQTVGELRDAYLEHRLNTVEANTVAGDRTLFTNIEDVFGRQCRPADMCTEDWQELFDRRAAEGYKPGTLRTYRTALGALLRWCGADPGVAHAIEVPDRGRMDVRAFTEHELERIREAADSVDQARGWDGIHRRMVEWLLASGCRQQEAFAAEWHDLHEGRRTARIVRQLTRTGDGPKPLKGKLARTALLLPEWWDHHRPDRSGIILLRRNGQRIRYQGQQKLIRRVLHAAGIHDVGIRFHAFRHTYARRFLELGGRLEELQKSLGHR